MLCLSLHTMRPNCRVRSEGSMAQQQRLSALSGARVACGWRREGCRAELTSRAMATPHTASAWLLLMCLEVCRASSSEGQPRRRLAGTQHETWSRSI